MLGEYPAFELVYDRHGTAAFSLAYRILGQRGAAEDATQEAFARAFARWRRLSRQDWAGAWVTTTALNVLRRRYRDAARSLVPVHERASHDSHGRVDLLRGLRALPVRQREAAVLFYVADLPLHAVGEAMGIGRTFTEIVSELATLRPDRTAPQRGFRSGSTGRMNIIKLVEIRLKWVIGHRRAPPSTSSGR